MVSELFSKIYKKIFSGIILKNPLFYQYRFDNLATRCNMGFIESDSFKKLHSKSIQFSGRDYKFYLRVHQVLWCASAASNIEGDYVELGTGRGYLFAAVCEYLRVHHIHKYVYLFDAFLPFKTDKNTGEQKLGQKRSEFYAESYEMVHQKFTEFDFVNLVQGKCPGTLKEIYGEGLRNISFLHVDLNYHKIELGSLEFLWQYLSEGAVILLDDYANPGRETQY